MDLNKSISQKEHIEMLQQCKKKDTMPVKIKIDNYYERYVNGDEYLLESIIEELDKMYQKLVIHQLTTAGCYNDENQHTAMQDARLAIWLMIQKSKKEKKVEPAFSNVCKGIYYHKVMDVVRAVLTERTRFGENYVDPKKKKEMKKKEENDKKEGRERTHRSEIESLDKDLPSENGTVGSLVADPKHDGNRPESVIEDIEKRKFFDTAFETYCCALMNCDAEPPRELALYYSRILPHILHICFSIDTIPDRKVASPKWAMEKMGQKTIGTLSTEAEDQLKEYVSPELMWCETYQKQLDREIATALGMQLMRNIIYVKEYDEKQIGHMTDYMHKVVAREWLQLMKKDPGVIESAIAYTIETDTISKALRGGLGR